MKKKENKKDFFVRITTIQLILFTLIFGAILLIAKLSDDNAEGIFKEYGNYMREDMSYEDIRALFDKEEQTTEGEGAAAEANQSAQEITNTAEAQSAPATTGEAYAFEEETKISLTDTSAAAEGYLAAMIMHEPVFPVSGRISSGYGGRISPISHYSEKHKGTDIAAPEGTPIKAVFSGTVSMVDRTPGRGNFVILDHGETADGKIQTLYQHCSKIIVKEGMTVRAGETIALVGSTGDSTGPHLHLEYRVNGECLDAIINIFGGIYEA